MNTAADAATDGLPTPRRYWAVLTIWLSMAMSVLDSAIANVALPTIAHDLHSSAATSIWIVNAYQLSITVALLPLAALGDKIGYRRVYLGGIVVFTLGSLACAFSGSLTGLAASRVVQGLGAAGLMSINAALVRMAYPKAMLGRGIGLNAMVVSGSAVIGPTVASAILALAPWPWLFAVNVPLGLLAFLIGRFALPDDRGTGAPLDLVSAGLNAVALAGVILGAETSARESLVVGLPILAVGGVAAVLLVRRQAPMAAPLLPVDLLRIPIFRLSIATSVVSFAAQMLAFISLPFFLQGQMGRSVVQTGVLMTPWPLAVCIAAPFAGRLADRYSAGILGGAGLAVFAAGFLLLAATPAHAPTLDIIWRMAVCGLGFGFFQSPNNRILVASAPQERSGAAGGMLATARLVGQTSGAVLMAVLFHLRLRQPTVSALHVAAAMAATGAVVSLLRIRLGPVSGAPDHPAVAD